jgi:membrane protease YdiL (CAAX protease family)
MAVLISSIIPALFWLSPLLYMIILPIAAILIWKNDSNHLSDLGFRFTAGWVVKLSIGLISGISIPMIFLAIQLFGGWVIIINRIESINNIVSVLLLLVIRMIFIVAIEELVFRGFLFQTLSRRIGFWYATIFSSFLWGLGHLTSMISDGLSPLSISIGMITFILWGTVLIFCFILAGKSLWISYGLHLGTNLCFSLIGWPFTIKPNSPQWWIGNPAWSPESGVIGILVWLLFAFLIYWLTIKISGNEFKEKIESPNPRLEST